MVDNLLVVVSPKRKKFVKINQNKHHFVVYLGLTMGTGIIFHKKAENFKKIFCF